MRQQIGAAIIGCGAISPLHAEAVNQMEGATLKIVVDPEQDKAEKAAALYGCEATADYRALLNRDDIQIVHLCTPHHLHADMAIELLAAGKHVLTEKPMAHNLEAATRMLKVAEQSSTQLGVVFQNRYNKPSQIIRDTIVSRSLGALVCMKGIVTWHRDSAYYSESSWRGTWATEGGGLMINQAIHTLDLLQWFGGMIKSVQGSVSADVLNDVIEVEDTAHASIQFESGARAIFYGTTAYLTNSPVELEVVFEHGTLHQRQDYLYLYKEGQESKLYEPLSSADETSGKSYWGSSHQRLISDFYTHVREGRSFWIDAAEGIKALQLISDIYHSSRSRESR